MRATLRPYHERLKADIERFGGTVEKFIGDAVMAVYGAPIAHEDDAERAVRSALRILESIEELNTEGALDLAVRAAVTTGEAVVTIGARPERGEAIVTGDVVNTAARLQGAAPVGSVVVDEATARASSRAIDYKQLEPMTVKGKAEPISVSRAISARSRFGVEADLRPRTAFVGREHELQLVLETFARVERESTLQLLTVVGEPGVGKSRLVAEFQSALDDRPEVTTWRQGRCLPYGEGITFWALGEIVKAEAGILESDDPAEASDKLARAVAAVVEDPSEREWFRARLAPLVGAEVEGESSRDESFTAWRRFLEALAARRQLVLVVEDVHWGDRALLEFLEHLLDWAAPVPLLVVCTARPELYERKPGWGGGRRNATTVGLSPLSEEETARLVAALLQRSVLPAETQALLLERSGGNPLYAEQFVRMQQELGLGAEIAVPETLQALIAGRLDTLAPELKAVLQDASVVGKVFWSGAVAALGGRRRDEVSAGLRELVHREFVRPARLSSLAGEEELSFWHALVRDVTYQQIARGPRATKHVAAAEWIERTAAERVADHAEILVHHYDQALELGRAAGEDGMTRELEARLTGSLVLAGDRALQLDIAGAEAAYRRAIALAGDSSTRPTVLARLGDALQAQGRVVEAEEAYGEAIPALQAAGEDRAAAVAMLGLGRTLWRRGHTARARETTAQGVAMLEDWGGPDLVLGYGRMAAIDALAGRPSEAIASADKGLELARELGVENVVRHLQMRGIARIDLGDPGGMDDMRAALELSLRLGLGEDTATSYGNLGERIVLTEGVAAGNELWAKGLEFARARGHMHHMMWSRGARLWYLFEEGEWDEILREADEVIRWDREQGGTQIEAWVLVPTSLILAHRGDTIEAARQASVFLPRAREVADLQLLLPALVHAAFIDYVRGDLATACALVEEYDRARGEVRSEVWDGLDIWALYVCVAAGEIGLGESLIRRGEPWSAFGRHVLLHGRAIVAEARGRVDEAAGLYAEAAERWAAWGSVPQRGYALLGLGRCGDDLRALAEGDDIFARLGAAPVAIHAAAA